MKIKQTTFAFSILFLTVSAFAAPQLTGGQTSAKAGQVAGLPVNFDPGSDTISALQFTLTLPRGFMLKTIRPGTIVTTASKSVDTRPKGRVWTILVFGMNENPIQKGELVIAVMKVARGTPVGDATLPIGDAVFTGPAGKPIKGTSTSAPGTVTVLAR